jgi:hypothetical protein
VTRLPTDTDADSNLTAGVASRMAALWNETGFGKRCMGGARVGGTGLIVSLPMKHGSSFTQKAGNLRRGKVEKCQAFVLERPQLFPPNG